MALVGLFAEKKEQNEQVGTGVVGVGFPNHSVIGKMEVVECVLIKNEVSQNILLTFILLYPPSYLIFLILPLLSL